MTRSSCWAVGCALVASWALHPGLCRADGPDGGGRAGAGDWDCQGPFTPPFGWQQETAFAPPAGQAGGGVDAAIESARARLVQNLCGSVGACGALRSMVTPWKWGHTGSQVCAMVVVKREDYAAWRKGLEDDLDARLHDAVKSLLAAVDPRTNQKLRVVIDRISYENNPGGPRAQWLRARIEQALHQAGVSLSDPPRGWAGDGLPPHVDMVIDGDVFPRENAARELPVLEVDWWGRVRDARQKLFSKVPAPHLELAALNAPPEEDPVPPIQASSEVLSVHLDAHPGGSLCRGERTQLYLHSVKALHVRVFDLYGKDGALLLFPSSDHPDDLVPAGATIAVGSDQGFEADPIPGSSGERFLVVGADSVDKLGPLADLSGYCRAPHPLAVQLHHGKGLPSGLELATDGFRLVEGGACPPVKHDQTEGVAASLESIPECR